MATPKKTNKTTQKQASAGKKASPAKVVKKAGAVAGKAPVRAAAKTAAKASPKVSPKTSPKTAVKAKASSKGSAKVPAKAPAKAAKPAAKAPVKTASKSAPKAKAPATKAVAKAPVKATAKPATKTAAKPVAKAKAPLKKAATKASAAPVSRKAPEGGGIPVDVQKVMDARKKDKKWLKFVETQKQHLLDLRDNILDSMAGVTRETLRNHPEGSEASGSGEHQADAGSDAYDRDFALSMLSKEQNALSEVEEALRRIDNGTYGICEISHKPIPILRLEAIPFARLTVECQSQWEKEKGLSARFVSRTDFGFGGIQNDIDSSVSLDEDEE